MTTQLAEAPAGRLLLHGLDWDRYRQIASALRGRHVRLRYDRGSLEFMTISSADAHLSRLLAQFVVVLTDEFGLPRRSFGDMTCDREDLSRGLEPDECFYITNEPAVRGREVLDLTIDPPPDLMIEIDLSRPRRDRPAIQAGLGVPELWQCDGQTLRTLLLTPEGGYVVAEEGRCIPSLRPAALEPFLQRRHDTDEGTLVREFRNWARAAAAPPDTKAL